MDNNKSNISESMLSRCVADCERTVIIHALMRTGGNQAAAAVLLGTTKRILGYKVHKYDIDCAKYRAENRSNE
jgi:Nif-specific regulatory protein